jgi:hypothetical protein
MCGCLWSALASDSNPRISETREVPLLSLGIVRTDGECRIIPATHTHAYLHTQQPPPTHMNWLFNWADGAESTCSGGTGRPVRFRGRHPKVRYTRKDDPTVGKSWRRLLNYDQIAKLFFCSHRVYLFMPFTSLFLSLTTFSFLHQIYKGNSLFWEGDKVNTKRGNSHFSSLIDIFFSLLIYKHICGLFWIWVVRNGECNRIKKENDGAIRDEWKY